ncbi:MAG TPA: hypothetical protein VM222_07550, partial [Planctomycetota bacterium]|nr:hypothetical protein [Planctomycetota bacterium]
EWKRNRPEEAKAWFLKARQQCEDMRARSPESPLPAPGGRKYHNMVSPLFAEQAKLYEKYPEIVDLDVKARSGKRADELALLKAVQDVIQQYGPIDEQWLWSRNNPLTLLNRIKVKVTGGEDLQECNDSWEMASELSPVDGPIPANLSPEGLDVDYYAIRLGAPAAGPDEVPLAAPTKPIKIRIKFTRPQGALLPLKATFLNPQRQAVRSIPVTPNSVLEVPVAEWGRYGLRVEAATPEAPWTGDPRYALQVEFEK